MDILDDMGVSKLSAKGFFLKVNYSSNSEKQSRFFFRQVNAIRFRTTQIFCHLLLLGLSPTADNPENISISCTDLDQCEHVMISSLAS